jgi:PAS domain S-box-containing protein
VRRGIRALLSSRPDLLVCGEAADGHEAISLAREQRPDVILMDISMPRLDGLEATRVIRREVPDSQIIIFSQNDPVVVERQARLVNARSYLSKSSLAHQLIPEIERISNSGNGASPHKSAAPDGDPAARELFAGNSRMAALMRSMDWSATRLGPVSSWSPALRMIVKLMLYNRFPQLLWWGPEFYCLYNDAYIPVLGSKHPWALGRPTAEVWGEIWHVLKPLIETPFHGGPATWMDDIPLEVNRSGFVEETHFTIAYSSVPDDAAPNGIGGVLATVHEISEKVVGERRVIVLRDLGASSADHARAEEACRIAAQNLGKHPKDIPFALLYLVGENRTRATLAACVGVQPHDKGCRSEIPLTGNSSSGTWPLAEVMQNEQIRLVEALETLFDEVPRGDWSDPPNSAAVIPIRSNVAHQLAGFVVAGISPRLRFDESYRNFLELLSAQIATIIANARAYEEERKRAEALAEIDRAKTDFFSNVSHEFRTPLTLMLGPLHDLLSNGKGELSPEAREQLDLVNRNGARLLRLVNTLLDFSRIEASRVQASYEPTDAAVLTAELASVFRSAIERAGLRFIVDCQPLSSPVYLDREMWEKIVFNLLSNAFKFTFSGEIEISLKARESSFELSVRDTGTGIPPEDVPNLFERFYRVKGARGRTFEGSGIGLALVQELAKLHGGNVRVESELDRGTTFTVSVPLGKAHLPADRIGAKRSGASTAVTGESFVQEALRWLPADVTSPDDSSAPTAASPLESPEPQPSELAGEPRYHILIADDNADMREYLQRLLRDRYDVVAVADGESALVAARKCRPDLILSDVMMPRLDGLGLLQAVRADEALRDLPVIFLSARAGEESRIEGISCGADDYLVKPFSARELLARVRSHLVIARIRGEAASLHRRLRLDTEMLAAIVASSDDAIVSKDFDGVITTWNKGAERIFGYTAEEAVGKHITLIVPPERHDEEAEILSRIRRGERMDHIQTIRRRKDGALIDVSATISPLKDANGKVIGASKVARDITERKASEEALAQSEQRLRLLVNASSYVVYRMSPDWTEMRRLDGRGFISDTDNLSTDWMERYIHPEDCALVSQKIQEAIRAKALFELEHRVLRADGSFGWTLSRAIPILDSNGEIVEWFGTASDVTRRKQAEEDYRRLTESLESEVRARTAELEERNRDLLIQSDRFRDLSLRIMKLQDEERRHVARELHDSASQTLAVLGMNLSLLAGFAGDSNPRLTSKLAETQTLFDQLTREIRTTSYLLHPPLLDESGLVPALTWYVQGLAERSQLEIDLQIPHDLGRLPREGELAIFRVVQECLANVLRHSGSQKASIRITRGESSVSVEVQDFGSGMSPEKLAAIQARGSGVGIRGMRERIRHLNGEMKIESSAAGTTVCIEIPVPNASASADEPTRTLEATG